MTKTVVSILTNLVLKSLACVLVLHSVALILVAGSGILVLNFHHVLHVNWYNCHITFETLWLKDVRIYLLFPFSYQKTQWSNYSLLSAIGIFHFDLKFCNLVLGLKEPGLGLGFEIVILFTSLDGVMFELQQSGRQLYIWQQQHMNQRLPQQLMAKVSKLHHINWTPFADHLRGSR